MFLRLLFLVVASAVLSAVARAQVVDPSGCYVRADQPNPSVIPASSLEADCQSWVAAVDPSFQYSFHSLDGLICRFTSPATGSAPATFGSYQSHACPEDACQSQVGASRSVNWTEGWSRTYLGANATYEEISSSFVGSYSSPPADGNVCVNGCIVAVNSSPSSYWSSPTPNAQGLYRLSADYDGVVSGSTCDASTTPSNIKTTQPGPSCPGAVGQVNGQTVCVGGPPSGASAPIESGEPSKVGNPTAGQFNPGVPSSTRIPSSGTGDAPGGPSTPGDGRSFIPGSPASSPDDSASSPTDGEEEDPTSECELHPDTAGCASLGTLDAQQVSAESVPTSITPDSGWSFAPATCPADTVVSTHTVGALALSWGPICSFASMIRPIILAFAWLTSAMLFLGLARKE